MAYLGRGPYENYWDRHTGSAVGVYSGSVEELTHVYTRPQENGNRTDVRWLTLTDSKGAGSAGGGHAPAERQRVAVTVWKTWRRRCTSTNLPRRDFITLNLDYRQMGVGGDDSWGARPHPEYTLPAKPYSYQLPPEALQPGHGPTPTPSRARPCPR